MSEPSWDELQRLWTSVPPHAAPVASELRRVQRMRPWRVVGALMSTAIATAGLAVGVWLIARGGALGVLVGSATLLFTAAVSALAIRARMLPRARVEDPVAQAVADAVRSARVGVRAAVATIYAVCAGMGFIAVVALARGLLAPEGVVAAGFVVIGVMQVWLISWLLFAFRYYRKCSGDLARLEAIAATLTAD